MAAFLGLRPGALRVLLLLVLACMAVVRADEVAPPKTATESVPNAPPAQAAGAPSALRGSKLADNPDANYYTTTTDRGDKIICRQICGPRGACYTECRDWW